MSQTLWVLSNTHIFQRKITKCFEHSTTLHTGFVTFPILFWEWQGTLRMSSRQYLVLAMTSIVTWGPPEIRVSLNKGKLRQCFSFTFEWLLLKNWVLGSDLLVHWIKIHQKQEQQQQKILHSYMFIYIHSTHLYTYMYVFP